jgi:hypothetical protein
MRIENKLRNLGRKNPLVPWIVSLLGVLSLLTSGGCMKTSAVEPSSALNAHVHDWQLFNTTYYPFHEEPVGKTTCGTADKYAGFYFAVSEQSDLWQGTCNNDSWGRCDYSDCLDKWDALPRDVKKIENNIKWVREPRCEVPCGRKHWVFNESGTIYAAAYVWDACPSQHWNNRYKEVKEGRNPCPMGAKHVDLRKPLFLHLNNGVDYSNIRVWIDRNPLPEGSFE